jgi:lipoprotein-anchoring transpeptidase ErfK/SrfK
MMPVKPNAFVLAAMVLFCAVEAAAQAPGLAGRSDFLFQPWSGGARGGLPGAPRANLRPMREAETVERWPPPARPYGGQRAGLSRELSPELRRREVEYRTAEAAGTLVVDTANRQLFLVLGGGRAIRYSVGVGREGFTWSGRERVSRKAEWPDWRPPPEMLARQPDLPRFMAGGLDNPLGARALYLGQTLYRIHGTNDPSSIGTNDSSGCIRLTNDDIIDLYGRIPVGAQVVVLPAHPAPSARRRDR